MSSARRVSRGVGRAEPTGSSVWVTLVAYHRPRVPLRSPGKPWGNRESPAKGQHGNEAQEQSQGGEGQSGGAPGRPSTDVGRAARQAPGPLMSTVPVVYPRFTDEEVKSVKQLAKG